MPNDQATRQEQKQRRELRREQRENLPEAELDVNQGQTSAGAGEDERKRALYQRQQKARMKEGLSTAFTQAKKAGQAAATAKEAGEAVAAGAASGGAGAAVSLVKSEAKRMAQETVQRLRKEGVGALPKIAGQVGGERLLDVLWSSLFTPAFPFCLLALNVYAFLSSGIILPELSKNLAPFALYPRLLPESLGRLSGIIALLLLDLLLFAALLLLIVLIYYLTHPVEGLMDLFVF